MRRLRAAQHHPAPHPARHPQRRGAVQGASAGHALSDAPRLTPARQLLGKVTIAAGGVLPNIHSVLLPKKAEKE
jgi:hypothetical protein